ncbi:hypothetical protein JCM5296_005945 [Sporobolomyces johnsonii]
MPSSLSHSTLSYSSASSSDGDSCPSLLSLSFSASASPSSSVAPSPSLDPKPLAFPPLASADDLSPLSPPAASRSAFFPGPSAPSATQLAAYASSIIRNEAYSLLALAARLAPASQPILPEDELDLSGGDASSSEGPDVEERMAIGSAPASPTEQSRPESRTNTAFRQVVELILSMPAHGKILVTGVGKSGIVGRKIVATFCSLGIQSVFLHPLEALHGDIGVVCACSPSTPCDTLLMISHSGATAELMRLLPFIRPRVRSLVAITRDPESVLARACHGWLDAGTGVYPGAKGGGTTDEADSALPAPTSSVVSALAVADALALTLSRLRIGWDAEGKNRRGHFFHCHPGGQLGIQLGREGRGVETPFPPTVTSAPSS